MCYSERSPSKRSFVVVGMLVALAVLGASPGAVAQVPSAEDPRDGPRGSQPATGQREGAAERFMQRHPDKARQIIVRFEDGVSEGERGQARRGNEVATERRFTLFDAEVVVPAGNASAEQTAERLNRDPRVRYAELNQVYFPQSHGAGAPDDPSYGQLWGMENTGQAILSVPGTPDVDVDANEAWASTEGDPNLVVAVIDTGTDISHPDLDDRIWVNPGEVAGNGTDDDGNGYVDDVHGWDFFNDDNTVYDAADGDDHGTHVSGTIAGEIGNATGVAGVAPQVQIMPLKFLGPTGGSTADAILALEYAAAKGVRISNNSWGCACPFQQALYDAIAASGQAFVTAAGNGGSDGVGDDNDAIDNHPSNYDLPNILAVAAVDNSGALAPFSNYGAAKVDLGAPGVDVLSTVPTVPATAALQNATATYTTMFWGFGLEDVVDTTSRRDMTARAVSTHFGLAADAPILLVDDDAGGSEQAFYAQALADAGFTNVTTHTVAAGASGPSAATMSGYAGVVWQTGGDYASPLTATDLSSLTSYLDSGGKNLLLAGADAIYLNEGSALVTSYLDVDHLYEEVPDTALEGVAGSVYAGQAYSLSATSNPYRDAVAPSPGGTAVPALDYPGGAYDYYSGTSMASPHAAGVAALVASLAPAMSATDMVELLKSTAVPLASLSGKTVTGGMVNAKNAVDAIERGSAVADFTGDGKTDFSFYRPSNGRWFINGVEGSTRFGLQAGDVPVPADYTGDGVSELAIYRPGTGQWYLHRVTGWTHLGGEPGDVPVPSDYTGDGKTDFAVYRPSNGRWFINGVAGSTRFGLQAGDVPVPADYTGDGVSELAIYRPSNGRWYLHAVPGSTHWGGEPGDVPVPADYTGDGKADFAIYRPSNGRWFINGVEGSTRFGLQAGDVPVPGDYTGDGASELAIYRPSNGRWYLHAVTGSTHFGGMTGDRPLPLPHAIYQPYFGAP